MRTRRALVGGLVAVGVLASGGGPPSARAQDRVPIDRWLVSSAFPVGAEGDPLRTDVLEPPGETGVLPDRGRTELGADWKLKRNDGTSVFLLDPHLEVDETGSGSTSPSIVVYAHAYLKAPADRTVRLTWGGVACTRVAAWINGRSIDELGRPADEGAFHDVPTAHSADVRIGFGYNTLLIKAISGDCPLGIAARLEVGADGALEGVRVQASRPYGDTRTGPRPWVIAASEAGPESLLGWKDETLFGAAAVRLAAFAVTPIEGAEIEAIVSGHKVKRDVEWLTPAEPLSVLVPFEFERLRTALVRNQDLELRLKWGAGESEGVLSLRPEPLLEAFHSSIRLLGWTAASTGDVNPEEALEEIDDEEPHPLANLIPLPKAAGIPLVGEWKIPGSLSGFTLRLDTRDAPGAYRIGSRPAEGDEILLCQACRKGQTIQIVVQTTGSWSRFPGAVIADPGAPLDRTLGQDEAKDWLKLLDDKGSREYLERAVDGTTAAAGN
jgi:hypothetical protein